MPALLNRLHNTSIKNKLTFLAMSTCVLAAIGLFALFIFTNIMNAKQAMLNEMQLLTNIIGERNVAAITFDDMELAEKSLQTLTIKSSIRLACIYRADGTAFARYTPSDTLTACPPHDFTGHRFGWNSLQIHHPIKTESFFSDREITIGSIYLHTNLSDLKESLLSTLLCLFAAVIAILGIAYLLATKVRNLIAEPITSLQEASANVAEGKFHVRAEKYYDDEIGELTESFNHMMEEIEDSRTNLESKVKARTQELEKALQAKSEFLANMSHEIRTPIHGIMNFTEFLVKDWEELNEREQFNYANRIQQSSLRLLDLTNNLLDLSKLDARKMTFRFGEYDIIPLIETVILECEPLYKGKKKISVAFDKPKRATSIECDRERITQVFRNLLGNAIKFTEQGTITIKMKKTQLKRRNGRSIPAISFHVIDEGIGIPDGEIEDIFQAFTQSSYTNTGAGGTGLGLSISMEIIKEHHGIIYAKNNANDQGACFTFTLPVKQPQKNKAKKEEKAKVAA